MFNPINWLTQPKLAFNADNVDILKSRIKTLINDDDSVEKIFANLSNHNTDIDEIKALLKIYQQIGVPKNHALVNQQLGVKQLIDNQWPLPSATMLYTTDDDILEPSRQLIVNGHFSSYDKACEYALHWLGYGLTRKPLQGFAIYLAPNGRIIQKLLKRIVNVDKIGVDTNNDPRFASLAQYLNNFEVDNLVTTLTTNSYDENEYEQADNFQNMIRYYLTDGVARQQLIPVMLDSDQMLAPTNTIIVNVEAISDSERFDIDDTMHELQVLKNNCKLHRVAKRRLITSSADASFKTGSSGFTRDLSDDLNTRNDNGGHTTKYATNALHRVLRWAQQRVNQKSSNQTTTRQKSFMKPNRRHPNNPNIAGRITKTAYKRDIHIYMDTSGSINSDEYQSGLSIIVEAAKRLNVDIYFSSFSDRVSAPFKLTTKNKSRSQIQQLLQKIPKVTGGTNFENVYLDILKTTNDLRKQHLNAPINIILTDFDYQLDERYDINPFVLNNTFYMALDPKNNAYARKYFINSLKYRHKVTNKFISQHFA